MKLSKQLTFLGATIVATSLIAGVGWVTAKSKSVNREAVDSVAQTDSQEEPQIKKTEGGQKIPSPGQLVRSQDITKRKGLEPEDFKKVEAFKPFLDKITKTDQTDTTLRELQKERCKVRASALERIERAISIGKWNPIDFIYYVQEINAFTNNLLDVVNTSEDKLKCYELRYNLLKDLAQFTDVRVEVGSDPVQNSGIANGAWIDAEIDLLKFKAEIEKAKK